MVKILHFHCPGPRFNPWSGNYDPTSTLAKNKPTNQKKKKKPNNKIKPTNKKPTQNKTTILVLDESIDSMRNLYQT